MIKLTCIKCGYSYSVSEDEFLANIHYHTECFMCSGELVVNYDDIVKTDIFQRAEKYLNKWFSELGLEGTLEILTRNKHQATYRIYEEILRKRGLVK